MATCHCRMGNFSAALEVLEHCDAAHADDKATKIREIKLLQEQHSKVKCCPPDTQSEKIAASGY